MQMPFDNVTFDNVTSGSVGLNVVINNFSPAFLSHFSIC